MTHTFVILVVMLFIFGCICIALAARQRIVSIISLSIISILSSLIYLFMDAPDVAMTEAAVGACISSCILMLGVRHLGGLDKRSSSQENFLVYALPCFFLFALLSYYSLDLHEYGVIPHEFQTGLTEFYKANVGNQVGVKSLVTAILADYRGMDTFCETLVIFTAGICVAALAKDSVRSGKKVAANKTSS